MGYLLGFFGPETLVWNVGGGKSLHLPVKAVPLALWKYLNCYVVNRSTHFGHGNMVHVKFTAGWQNFEGEGGFLRREARPLEAQAHSQGV